VSSLNKDQKKELATKIKEQVDSFNEKLGEQKQDDKS